MAASVGAEEDGVRIYCIIYMRIHRRAGDRHVDEASLPLRRAFALYEIMNTLNTQPINMPYIMDVGKDGKSSNARRTTYLEGRHCSKAETTSRFDIHMKTIDDIVLEA